MRNEETHLRINSLAPIQSSSTAWRCPGLLETSLWGCLICHKSCGRPVPFHKDRWEWAGLCSKSSNGQRQVRKATESSCRSPLFAQFSICTVLSESAEDFLAMLPKTKFYCLRGEKLQNGCFCHRKRGKGGRWGSWEEAKMIKALENWVFQAWCHRGCEMYGDGECCFSAGLILPQQIQLHSRDGRRNFNDCPSTSPQVTATPGGEWMFEKLGGMYMPMGFQSKQFSMDVSWVVHRHRWWKICDIWHRKLRERIKGGKLVVIYSINSGTCYGVINMKLGLVLICCPSCGMSQSLWLTTWGI